MVIKTHTTGNEEANRVVSRKAHIFVVCGAGRQARAGPLPGLALIGFATLARAWPRFQLAQTREQMPNLVWHLLFHHVFRGNPQDGPEPLEEMKIKKSMHGCYLSMDTALHWQRLPVSHGQCVRSRVVPGYATGHGCASVRGLGCLGYSTEAICARAQGTTQLIGHRGGDAYLSTGLSGTSGTWRRAPWFLTWWIMCRVSTQNEPVMKVLKLAATAAAFAAIFSAMMLCGAALTATLHKAIASAPVGLIVS